MQHSHKIQELIKPTLPLPPSLCHSIFSALSSPRQALAALSRATAPPCGLLGGWRPRRARAPTAASSIPLHPGRRFSVDRISNPGCRPHFRRWEVGEGEGRYGKKRCLKHKACMHRCSRTQLAISDCTLVFFCSPGPIGAHQPRYFLQWGGVETPGGCVELQALQTSLHVCALRSRLGCCRKISHKILARFEEMLS